ncbi:hypothetical protein SDC9_125076 [bioreactor metagenome]|uniref:Uncharacterized protein n=1 Tax=bioreactor metagenome TaxID=1076179 RepID=A0A645CM30_9ZZZZ|nr:chorion class high-cysteine HCB protein 13 [Lutispora sp.]MEA4962156.1 chorion class high-cysteine HCB protein 13 [Lutispora sp.]
MGIASQECCEPTGGLFGSNWIWIILLILFFCGGFGGSGCGGGILGGNFLGNNGIWIILIILFFFCFCGKRIF